LHRAKLHSLQSAPKFIRNLNEGGKYEEKNYFLLKNLIEITVKADRQLRR